MPDTTPHLNISEEGKKSRLAEQENILREKSLEKIFGEYKNIIEGADSLGKDVFSRDDILLVAGGIKPATDLEVADVIVIRQLAEKQSLDILGLKISKSDKPGYFYIYNPKLLMLRTQESRFLIPFGEGDDLNLWIEKNREIGVDKDLILGTLYGFPESSIEFYIFYKKATHEEHLRKDYGDAQEKELAEKALKEEREKRWHLIEDHGEAYAISDPKNLEPDVLAHEQMKKEFFKKLEANKEFWELFQKIKKETQ